jgi:hypothetical protein
MLPEVEWTVILRMDFLHPNSSIFNNPEIKLFYGMVEAFQCSFNK